MFFYSQAIVGTNPLFNTLVCCFCSHIKFLTCKRNNLCTSYTCTCNLNLWNKIDLKYLKSKTQRKEKANGATRSEVHFAWHSCIITFHGGHSLGAFSFWIFRFSAQNRRFLLWNFCRYHRHCMHSFIKKSFLPSRLIQLSRIQEFSLAQSGLFVMSFWLWKKITVQSKNYLSNQWLMVVLG